MMWSPEKPSGVSRWSVLRLKAGSRCRVELLSGDFVRLTTHFAGSTFLCPETEECDACDVLPARAYWYLPAVHIESRACVLLELSATASQDLEQVCRFAGKTFGPGCQVEIGRRTAKSPLRSEFLQLAERASCAKLHEWVSRLAALFRLPAMQAGETLEAFGTRTRPKVVARAKVMADVYKASAAKGVKVPSKV